MSSTSDHGRGPPETSPIVDQFENREDGSSRECPDADDPSAKIGVSDDCIAFMRGVLAVIFGRHGPNYLRALQIIASDCARVWPESGGGGREDRTVDGYISGTVDYYMYVRIWQ